jgi:hypothetical protein
VGKLPGRDRFATAKVHHKAGVEAAPLQRGDQHPGGLCRENPEAGVVNEREVVPVCVDHARFASPDPCPPVLLGEAAKPSAV